MRGWGIFGGIEIFRSGDRLKGRFRYPDVARESRRTLGGKERLAPTSGEAVRLLSGLIDFV